MTTSLSGCKVMHGSLRPKKFEYLFLLLAFTSLLLLPSSEQHDCCEREKSYVEDADLFTISYEDSFKMVKNLLHNISYKLMEKDSNVSAFNRCKNTRSFHIPLNNYTTDSTISVAYFELLGILYKMKGVTTDYISSPCALKYIRQGKIKPINASDPAQSSSYEGVFTSLNPSSETTRCTNINFDSTFDPGPLKRAEWIKYIATFFNCEKRATYVYNKIKDNYNCLKKQASNATKKKPNVAWLSYYQGIWSFSGATYKLQYILDAGGIALNPPESTFNMSKQKDVQLFHSYLERLEVLIDETYAPIPKDYTLNSFLNAALINSSQTASFAFLKHKALWRYDKRVGNTYGLDWFEGAIAQPQVVLWDLIQAFNRSDYYITVYFRNVAKGESMVNTSKLNCSHTIKTPLQPEIIPCHLTVPLDLTQILS
ncbi:uncharacterized protein LOC131040636 [Cryptomeria japonica]|uniref:uncharacterized protein LOC131040636 n=1 Tax=Cryptomeria japonica TaxID=3369 RepID=UPI0027DA792E|nr:uncharacterized protein LOC131040636 [Cryptomeria japonica]